MTIHSLREPGESFLNATPQDQQKKRRSVLRGWLITGIFLLLCIGIVLYFSLKPERFPVIYQIQGNELTSPANGEIRFLASAGKMAKGSLIAEILVPPESGGTLLEQAHLLQDRLRNMREEERKDAERVAEMRQNVEQFQHEQKRTEADLRLARQSRSQCTKILEMQKKRRDSARRLFQLEAIRNSELSDAEEQYNIAADELKKTELQIQKNEILLDSIQKAIQRETLAIAEEERNSEQRMNLNRLFRQQLEKQLSLMKFVPEGMLLQLHAGNGGILFPASFRTGDKVVSGEILGRLLSERHYSLTAYIPENSVGNVAVNDRLLLRLGKRKFSARVSALDPDLKPLPKQVYSQAKHPDGLFRAVNLEFSEGRPEELLNGQTGTAVFW